MFRFLSGGIAGTENIPNFAATVAQHHANYYDEMSYNTHHVNTQVIQRPSPNQDKAFHADSSLSYYQDIRLTELNTEILDKAWQENNNVFNGIDVVFIFYGGNVFTGGTALGDLSHNSSHYSGCGAIIEWGYFGVDEEKVHKWHMAHEYGHLLSPDGTYAKRLWDQYTQPGGIYNIMYQKHLNVTQPMSAFNLIYLGWIKSSWIKEIDPATLTNPINVSIKDTRLAPSSGNYNVARIKIPGTTNEHFIIENRQGTGSDAYLSAGGKGLTIWHMAKAYSSYNTNSGMDVEIATALDDHGYDYLDNGIQSGEERGFATDFFDGNNKITFAPYTNPSTESGYKYSYSHSFTDIALVEITKSGTTMSFNFLPHAPPGAPKNLVISNAGHNGQHPILQWDANSEPDLSHYQIYRGDQDPETGQVNWSGIATTSNTTWTDPDITINTASQTTIFYRVTAVDNASLESDYSNQVWTNGYYVPKVAQTYASKDLLALPQKLTLLPNYPNPFNPETAIRYGLPAAADVQLVILNILGQPVRTLVSTNQSAGWYSLKWDGRDAKGQPVASGIYLYRLQVRPNDGGEGFVGMRKMLLAR